MLDIKHHLKKQCSYTFLLILFLLMCCNIFYKYNLISYENFKRTCEESSSAIVTQQRIQLKPLVKSTLELVTTSGKYYVKTSQCQMPYVNPFTEPILKTFIPIKYKKCNKKLPLYTSTYNKNIKKYVLHLNKHVVLKYFPQNATSEEKDLQCHYRQIKREAKGDSFVLLERKKLFETFEIPREIHAMVVKCILKSTNEVEYLDAFTFIQYKELKYEKKPGVLLIGIDSLSRINLRRVMPKTYEYLKSTWFELEGYNKVGDNTFPNLMPTLTGYNLTTALDKCRPTVKGGLNSPQCSFIWKTFKRFGYRTAYAEDAPFISTFNFKKKGFSKQPTDYYLRPWMEGVQKYFKVKRAHGRLFCIGYRYAGEYIYDYAQQFAKAYEGESIFGLFWTNTFSHNNYKYPSMIDGKMVEHFKSFEKDGIFDSAIVIFFSDHGMRWGELTQLPEAYYEQRLPTFFISLPKSFKQKHPDYVKALQVNRNRLTSPYDIHMTLNHILELYEPNLKLPHADSCKKCQSIFRTIPENRTCLDAGIPDHWCTCSQYKRIYAKNDTIKKITKKYIKKINKYLNDLNLASYCQKLSLNKVIEIYLKVEKHTPKYKPTYKIKFDVQPSNDTFETTVTYDPKNDSISYASVADIEHRVVYKPRKCLRKVIDRVAEKLCICI